MPADPEEKGGVRRRRVFRCALSMQTRIELVRERINMPQRVVCMLAVGAIAAVLLWLAPDVLLIVFAGILFGVFLRSGGSWIAKGLGVGPAVGLGIFGVALVAFLAGFLAFAGSRLADQFQNLLDGLPRAIEAAKHMIDAHDWMQRGVGLLDVDRFLPSGREATSVFSTTLGFLGSTVVVVFIGLYSAANPELYVRGIVALVAPSMRPRAADMLAEAGQTLRAWLLAQFVSMAVVGILTGIGLWALGGSLPLVLAVLAALLTFIPNIGPVLAATPAVLIGLTDGPMRALWIAALYVAIQFIESYVITPRVQERTVALPPAFTISMQLLFGVMFGTLGLALATPVAAVLLALGKRFYVADFLDREPRVRGG
ncbi:AI-2E family transporter [Bradyrhizobium oligotrophicum]|uniref:AI-2E family transporter n=1 Tax=Bradyrhizobium oligotrophicum TaxID=44255 RepID=UPI003EBEAB70